MKKVIPLLLTALLLTLCSLPAHAAREPIAVTQQNTVIEEKSDGVNVYLFVRLESSGAETVSFESGLFEVFDTAGALLGTDEAPAVYAAKYLKKGEYGYLKACVSLENVQKEAIGECRLTLESEFYTGRARIQRYAAEPLIEEDVTYGGFLTYDYMGAVFTNTTAETLFDLEAVFALLDSEGNILNVGYAFMGILNDVGLHPGSTVTLRDVNSDGLQAACAAEGLIPERLDAIVYREIYS